MEPKKGKWSRFYSLVLIANVVYIILFYVIMKFFCE